MSAPSSSQTPVPKVLSDAELDHFNSIPWAKSILQTSLQPSNAANGSSSDYVAIEMPARTLKETDEDGYFAGTLATPETIPFIVTLRRRELLSPLPQEPPVVDPKSVRATPPSRPPDTITLVSLSAPGISGHVSTAHGGVLATLFDEAMYLAAEAHVSSKSATSALDPRERDRIYTAQLNVRYRKPVYAPGLLVIRSWCVAHAGRKYWTLSHAVQEEQGDDAGHLEWAKRKPVCAEASSLWVITRDEKL